MKKPAAVAWAGLVFGACALPRYRSLSGKHYTLTPEQAPCANQRLGAALGLAALQHDAYLCFDHFDPAAPVAAHHVGRARGAGTLSDLLR